MRISKMKKKIPMETLQKALEVTVSPTTAKRILKAIEYLDSQKAEEKKKAK